MGWSDIGGMGRVWHDILPGNDNDRNVVMGQTARATSASTPCHRCLIQGTDRLVATVGLEGMIVIVDTGDALLVLPQEPRAGCEHTGAKSCANAGSKTISKVCLIEDGSRCYARRHRTHLQRLIIWIRPGTPG
jgi:hypothetical protein